MVAKFENDTLAKYESGMSLLQRGETIPNSVISHEGEQRLWHPYQINYLGKGRALQICVKANFSQLQKHNKHISTAYLYYFRYCRTFLRILYFPLILNGKIDSPMMTGEDLYLCVHLALPFIFKRVFPLGNRPFNPLYFEGFIRQSILQIYIKG